MAKLIFEIWECKDGHSFECSSVGEHADKLRIAICPSAELLFAFSAVTDHEAAQKNYNFHGFGTYDPGDFPDRRFTDEEEREQQKYLTLRACQTAGSG